jgi:nitroreductase
LQITNARRKKKVPAMSILTEKPNIKYSEPAIETQFEEFKKVVESRRSVRLFTSDTIPESVMRECLQLGLLAPNSSNLQSWEFYWVRNSEKKRKLVEACFSQPAAATAKELIVCATRIDRVHADCKRMLTELNKLGDVPKSAIFYYEKLAPLVYLQGPLNIIGWIKKIIFSLVGIFKPVPREPNSRGDMRRWAIKSTALACENLMLAFRAAGYDTCPMEGIDSSRVKKILNLKYSQDVVMVLGCGKRAPGGIYGPRVRFDSKDYIKEV